MTSADFRGARNDEHILAPRRPLLEIRDRRGERRGPDLFENLGQLPGDRHLPVAERVAERLERRGHSVGRLVEDEGPGFAGERLEEAPPFPRLPRQESLEQEPVGGQAAGARRRGGGAWT